MKRNFLLLIITLLMVVCGCKTAKSKDYIPKRSDYTFRTEVRTINNDGEVLWDTIVVYLTDAKGYTQQLYSQALPLDTTMWSKETIGRIIEDDWNFDGIPDLQVSMGPMNGSGNVTYDVWLWDDTAHKFVYLETPAEIFDPYIDSENKMIVSSFKLDGEEEIIRYKWKDGKLVVAEREHSSSEEISDEGDEPWALTEDCVIEDIQAYFNDVNKTLAEGSGLSPFDLDKKWYTTHWNEVYNAVNEKDGKARQAEDRFFVEDHHWTAGLMVPVEVKNIKVEIQEDAYSPVAEAIFTLIEKESGLKKSVIIELKYEGARYLISNWLEKSHDAQGSLLLQMEKHIGQ